MRPLYRLNSQRTPLADLDVGLLPIEDRAALRLLNRIDAATPRQLATLIYSSERTAYRHLRRLWDHGLLERASLPLLQGVAPIAYRLSARGRIRLGYRPRRASGVAHLRHTLDINDVVCALVTTPTPPGDPASVQVWLPESLASGAVGNLPRPDTVLVLRGPRGSGVVCLEMDESTEHSAEIRAKLESYDHVLATPIGWLVLFVVPTADRLAWLDRVASAQRFRHLDGRIWGAIGATLREDSMETSVAPLGWGGRTCRLSEILDDPRPRSCPTPVATGAWVSLLGAGGGEELDLAFA